MAVHVSSLKQTNHEALSKRRPMAALLSSLGSFFRHYQSLERLDGVLYFSPDGSSSEFRRRERQRGCSPWAELSVLDPTREGTESLSLVSRLHPATQLLLGHELQRAYQRIEAHRDNREMLEDALRPVPEGINALPSFIEEPLCALVVRGELSPGTGSQQVELAVIEKVTPRPGWMAPFLLRSDERSQMTVRLMDLEDRSGRCRFRRVPRVTLCQRPASLNQHLLTFCRSGQLHLPSFHDPRCEYLEDRRGRRGSFSLHATDWCGPHGAKSR